MSTLSDPAAYTVDPAALPGFSALRGRHYFTDQDYHARNCSACSTWPSPSRRSTGNGRSRPTSRAARWR